MLMRPERISMSAWRGDARKASKPKRAMSRREAGIDIISIAQQASPNVAGNSELPRAPFAARCTGVSTTRPMEWGQEPADPGAQHDEDDDGQVGAQRQPSL